MNVIDLIQKEQEKPTVPEFRSGDTVKVYSKVVEGGKERIQMFEGVVTVRKGGGAHESVVVRRVAHGVGVEKTFLLHSPRVDRGLPLGLAMGDYSETEVSLSPGSRFIFYSDG